MGSHAYRVLYSFGGLDTRAFFAFRFRRGGPEALRAAGIVSKGQLFRMCAAQNRAPNH
jgi:hypothetical protein